MWSIFSVKLFNSKNYLFARTELTVNLFLPLALLLANTFLPFLVDILSLKPCLFLLFLLDGWNVLFMTLKILFYPSNQLGCKYRNIFKDKKFILKNFRFYFHLFVSKSEDFSQQNLIITHWIPKQYLSIFSKVKKTGFYIFIGFNFIVY